MTPELPISRPDLLAAIARELDAARNEAIEECAHVLGAAEYWQMAEHLRGLKRTPPEARGEGETLDGLRSCVRGRVAAIQALTVRVVELEQSLAAAIAERDALLREKARLEREVDSAMELAAMPDGAAKRQSLPPAPASPSGLPSASELRGISLSIAHPMTDLRWWSALRDEIAARLSAPSRPAVDCETVAKGVFEAWKRAGISISDWDTMSEGGRDQWFVIADAAIALPCAATAKDAGRPSVDQVEHEIRSRMIAKQDIHYIAEHVVGMFGSPASASGDAAALDEIAALFTGSGEPLYFRNICKPLMEILERSGRLAARQDGKP